MSKRYEPQNIEKKWQKIWQDEKAFAATDDYTKPKYYALVEFPYRTTLRSMTGGSGDFSYEFARYEQAPSDIQAKEIEARASKVEKAEE